MIKLNDNKVRVRCLECKEEHYITLEHVGTDKQQRTLGYEYEHIYRGESECSHCKEKMKLLITIFEYPKDVVNYVDDLNEGCLIMGEIKYHDDKVDFNVNK